VHRLQPFLRHDGPGDFEGRQDPLCGRAAPRLSRPLPGSAIDTRLYAHGQNALPGKYWFFDIELQSDSLRDVSNYWLSAYCMGSSAAYEPEIPLGAQMDAAGGQGAFDTALKNAGRSEDWGAKFLKHQWLSVGWTHFLGRDGLIHRAAQTFMRSYWDAGSVDDAVYDTILHTSRAIPSALRCITRAPSRIPLRPATAIRQLVVGIRRSC
jgi:hypothetical protein